MTKYKLNNTLLSSSEVTLTSYLTGSTDSTNGRTDSNQNDSQTENNQNVFSDRLAASLVKQENKFGLNELRVDNLDRNLCLCERYNGGCKVCPRASIGKSCATCYHGPLGALPYDNNAKAGFTHPTYNEEEERGWRSLVARRARSCCSAKTLRKRVPLLTWLPHYTCKKGLADLIAGVTVGLTVIPQAIAYANVAGLPPQYGLYSSFMACFVYTIFGSVKDSAIGPTAIAAILTRENLHGLGPDFAVLLCFLSGCVELLMGILQLGFLIDFISGPVSVGFTSAAAIIIATTQVKDILGLDFPGGKFLQVWTGIYEHIGESRLWDTVLGVTCIVALLLLRKVKDIKLGSSDSQLSSTPGRCQNLVSQSLWLLSTARNILVVLLSSGLAYYYATKDQTPFKLTGEVQPGLPPLAPPPFWAVGGNHTYDFAEMTSTLGSAIIVVPLLSILENIALAKVFSEGQPIQATQEMLALGVCNMAAAFVRSMPVSGALSRGAVNHASGVATTAGGVYTGIIVLLALQYLTPYFYYIPRAALAAVIIAAVIFMMELHVFKPIWKTKRVDIIPALVTFACCLATRLELGIVFGVAVNAAFLLHAAARPRLAVTQAVSSSGVSYVLATVDRSLRFPSAEFVRKALRRAGASARDSRVLVLDASHVHAADFTSAKGIKSLIDDFHASNQSLVLFRLKPSLASMFASVRPRELLLANCPEELDLMLQRIYARHMGTVGDVIM